MTALLRRWEAEAVALERREYKSQQTIEMLEADLCALKEKGQEARPGQSWQNKAGFFAVSNHTSPT
jgi:hypothetical protein